LHHLDFQSFWTDEISSLRLATGSLPETLEGLRGDVHPPLYFVLLNVWIDVFGDSELAVRAPSVIAGVLATGFVFSLGVTLFGVRSALFATLYSAASLFQIYYAQEARSYAQLSLLSILSMHAFVRGLASDHAGRGGGWRLGLYVLASTALLYTHYFGVFVLIAQALFLCVAALRRSFVSGRIWLRWTLAQAAALVLFLPWVPIFIEQLQRVQRGFWIPPATWQQLLRTPAVFLSLQRPPWGHRSHWEEIGIAMIALSIAGLGLAALAAGHWSRALGTRESESPESSVLRWPRGAAIGLLVSWLAVPVLLAWSVSVWQSLHIYTFRNLIVSQPAMCLLLAAFTMWMRSRSLRSLFAAAVLACSLGQLPWYYETAHKGRWRELVAFVERWSAPADGVAFYAHFVKQSFDFYRMRAERGPYRFVDLRETRPPREPRIWVVKAHARMHNFRDARARLRAWGYDLDQTWKFSQAELLLFTRPRTAKERGG
jgi:4-amino-4-deoxy-L-arabinose transferase-like glycosyltransferase